MQFRALVAFAVLATAAGRRNHVAVGVALNATGGASLDINQKVYIENAPVLGDGAGEALLGKCTNFAASHVSNPDAPKVKVCGTGIKCTVYLMGDPPAHHSGNDCNEYYEYQWTVGKCDKGLPSDTCDEISPAEDPRVGAAQSYIIEQC